MNLQRYYKRVSPATGSVQGSALSDTVSPSEVYRTGLIANQQYAELGRAGNMLTKVGLVALREIKKAEYYDQRNQAKVDYLQAENDFMNSLGGDPSTWLSDLQKHQTKVATSLSEKLTNRAAADDIERWRKLQDVLQQRKVLNQANQAKARIFAKKLEGNIEFLQDTAAGAFEESDYNRNRTELAFMLGIEPIDKDDTPVDFSDTQQIAKRFQPIPNWDNEYLAGPPEYRMKMFQMLCAEASDKRQKAIEKANIDFMTRQVDKNALEYAIANGGDLEYAVRYVNDPKNQLEWETTYDVPPKTIKEMTSNLSTRYHIQQELKEKERQKRWNATETEAFNLFRQGKLTPDWIAERFNADDMSKNDRDTYLKMLRKPVDVPLDIDGYNKVMSMIDDVRDGKKTVEEAKREIASGVGKYYDAEVGKQLRNKLSEYAKAGSPLNQSTVKNGIETIKQIRDLSISNYKEAGKKKDIAEKLELEWTFLRIRNEFEQFVLEHNPSAKEQEEWIKFNTKEPRKKIALNIVQRILLTKRRRTTPYGMPIPTEQEVLAKKKVDVLIEEGIWDKLSDEEKDEAKRAFARGETIDEWEERRYERKFGGEKKGHSNLFIDGLDTRTADLSDVIKTYVRLARKELGEDATPEEVVKRAKEMAKAKGWKIE